MEESQAAEKRVEELKAQQEKAAEAASEKASEPETEEEMRARIEAEVRAEYEAKARAKAEAEARAKAQETAPADFAAPKSKRPYVADRKLAAALDRAFDKLKAYFPEGKVFAFDNIDSGLRERMAELYKKAGYSTLDDMLAAYGFEIISGDEVKAIRSFVRYTPGNEPDCIKVKVDNVLAILAKHYPDHVIPRSLQRDHKSLSGKVSGMSQWLGYESTSAFLAAYGYEYNVTDKGGRPARDYDELVNALIEKYKNCPKPKSMGNLLFENPDLKGAIKTLQNKSVELYGMSLQKYFETVGILTARNTAPAHNDIRSALTAAYSDLDESEYGTAEDAMSHLECMNVKQNKAGKIYIFRAAACGSAVTIPYGIDHISKGAFSGQQNLKEVVISAALSEIPREAFSDCVSLERIKIPEGFITIDSRAFANCTSLKSIILPKSLQKLGTMAFVGCASLTKVEFLNPVTIVGKDAFVGCAYTYEAPNTAEATDSKYFKYSVDRKGYITISGFNGDMEKVVIPDMIDGHTVTAIGNGAFVGCRDLVEVSMSDQISTMQGNAFSDCISLKKIHLSNSISKIVAKSFSGCIGLKDINIPDGVTEIKKSTFSDSPLERLHIGKSLASIDSKLFYNGERDPRTHRQITTRAINKITVDPENPYLTAVGSLVLSKDGKTLYAALGNKRSISIPEGVETISSSAFENLIFLSDISLPDSLVSVGRKAFANTALRSITFGPNVKRIEAEAFTSCQNLTAAVFNEGLESIGAKAFYYVPIVSVLLPGTLRELGSYSFDCLSGEYYYAGRPYQELQIAASNPYIKADGNALYMIDGNNKTLQAMYNAKFHQLPQGQKRLEYVVQEGTTHIATAAFGSCMNLSKVTLPDGLVSIGASAFMDCQNLKDIVLPASVEVIREYAFLRTALTEFKLGAALRAVGAGAFATGVGFYNQGRILRSIKVDKGNSIFYVHQNALMKKLPDGTSAVVVYFGSDNVIALPDGVSEICCHAFVNSTVQEIQIPSTVTSIGDKAFAGCTQLTRLRIGLAAPENGVSSAVIYFPKGRNEQNSYIRGQYMDCIRINSSDTVFDFTKYDSLFPTISAASKEDKILIATSRLKSAIQLAPLYRNKYIAFLRRNAQKAVEVVVEYDDWAGLNTLAELGIFTGQNIDDIIEFANRTQKTELLSYLMNYKNSKIGITAEDYDL